MIEFDFKEEEYIIENEEEFKDVMPLAISETCFLYPIVFIINDIDFFLFRDKYGLGHLTMPIVNLASEGLYHVRRLPEKKKITYDLPEGTGYLYLTIDNHRVKISLPVRNKEAEVDYQELLDAFLQFREKVRSFLRERTPHILKHPYWGSWVAGEEHDYDKEWSQN